MEKSTLEAFVVKGDKILLPQIKKDSSSIWCSDNIESTWYKSTSLWNKTILIEANYECVNGYFLVNGYTLYGTIIPVVFDYPHYQKETKPPLQVCIGIEGKEGEFSRFLQQFHSQKVPNDDTRIITDEKVIEWLEKEDNIQSMKQARAAILEYDDQIKEAWEKLDQKRLRAKNLQEMIESVNEQFEKENESNQQLLEKNSQLIKRYQS